MVFSHDANLIGCPNSRVGLRFIGSVDKEKICHEDCGKADENVAGYAGLEQRPDEKSQWCSEFHEIAYENGYHLFMLPTPGLTGW